MKKSIFDIIVPVDTGFFDVKLKKSEHMLINKIQFPKNTLPDTKIAILGIGEGLMSLRKTLYNMYCDYNISVSDVGNIPLAKKDKLSLILDNFHKNNIFTIIIGNSTDVSSVCFDSLAGKEPHLSVSVVTPSVKNEDFLSYILNKGISHLFNFNVLAFQSYLSDPEVLNTLSSNYFETLRLGKFREDNRVYEPVIRDSDMLSFDIASIKKSEALDSSLSGANGLYSEEACLISRYAGISDRLKLVNIFSNKLIDENGQTSELAAQMVWHIIDGFAHRTNENMLNNVNGIKKILVNLEAPSEQLIFYHSSITNRWWLEVQSDSEKKPLIVACSEEDYKTACKHDIPLKWIWYQQKLFKKN